MEEKVVAELKKFDETLARGTFQLNEQSEFLQSSKFLAEAESSQERHSAVCDFIEVLQGTHALHEHSIMPNVASLHNDNSEFVTTESEQGDPKDVALDFSKLLNQTSSQILPEDNHNSKEDSLIREKKNNLSKRSPFKSYKEGVNIFAKNKSLSLS